MTPHRPARLRTASGMFNVRRALLAFSDRHRDARRLSCRWVAPSVALAASLEPLGQADSSRAGHLQRLGLSRAVSRKL